jgi:hypothetical protein
MKALNWSLGIPVKLQISGISLVKPKTILLNTEPKEGLKIWKRGCTSSKYSVLTGCPNSSLYVSNSSCDLDFDLWVNGEALFVFFTFDTHIF